MRCAGIFSTFHQAFRSIYAVVATKSENAKMPSKRENKNRLQLFTTFYEPAEIIKIKVKGLNKSIDYAKK